MALLAALKGALSGGEIIEKIGSTVDKFVTTKEEKERFNIELKKVLADYELKLLESSNKELDILLKDIASARDANVKIQESEKASFWAKNTGYFLDVFIGLVWGTMTIFLLARALKLVENQSADLTAVLSLYSTVTAVFMICINFHRGTSVGSERKQKQIERMIK